MHDERVPRGAIAAGLFLYLLLAGLDTKAWIVLDLAMSGDSFAPLLWLPVAVGGELLLAGAFFVAALACERAGGRAGRLGLWAVVVLGIAAALWMTANVLSYAIDQSPITWARLIGGDGGTLKDLDMIEIDDALPVVVLALLHTALVVPLLRSGWRVLPGRAAIPLVALFGGGALFAADRALWAEDNLDVGEQSVFAFLTSFGDTSEDGLIPVDPPTEEGWRELLRARNVAPEHTAPVERGPGTVDNVVIFFSEGIAHEFTSLSEKHGKETTPNLLRRARQAGLEMTEYRAPFHRSIHAIHSLACADYSSPDGANIAEVNPRIDCGELSQVMAARGVKTGLFHAGPFGFYDKLAFLGRRAYDVQIDGPMMDDGSWFTHRWGVDDRAMVKTTLDWIDSLPQGERFTAFMIPISAHYPFEVPPDAYTSGKKDHGNRFLDSVRFLDQTFEELMKGLEQRGLDQNTLVVFLSDHGSPFSGGIIRTTRGKRLFYENNLRVPAILFNPKLFPTPRTTARPATHIDVVPTILDAMGLPPDPRHRGQSILSSDYEPRRTFIGALQGTTDYVGFVDGHMKLIVDRRSHRMELYDLRADPNERRNIVGDHALDARRWMKDALTFYRWQRDRVREAPSLGDELDVPGVLMTKSRVVVRRGADEVCAFALPAEDPAAACPGGDAAAVPTRRVVAMDDVERDCVVVQPPPGGSVEIALDAPKLLPWLTTAWIAPVAEQDRQLPFSLRVSVDGEEPTDMELRKGAKWARLNFKRGTRSVVYTVAVEGEQTGPVCFAIDERSWAGRSLEDEDDHDG